MFKPYAIVSKNYSMILRNDKGYFVIGTYDGVEFDIKFPLVTNNLEKYLRFCAFEQITVQEELDNADMIEAAIKACEENEHYLDMLGKDLG
jgi:hypothetical protein